MTSYQKLKQENKKLKEDIYKLIDNDIEIKAKYQFRKSLQDLCMFGNVPDVNEGFNGLLPKIKTNKFYEDNLV